MLGLKLATDPRWVNIVESNIEEILTDHAWCEQKAASNAISLITQNSEKEELVNELILIAQEEMEHFKMVHDLIKERGLTFGRERKDSYVNELFKFMKKDGSRNDALCERLLFSAMIEARSCERFKVLSENIKDPELAKFYRDLMISEAGHYTTFLGFARKYADNVDVDKRWKEWIDYETSIIVNYGKDETVHG
ncbi:tRNA-(ms[2]io[6]A)-hydroxylase [Flavobacterium glycines]|uniref:tRNA 2-methylthio-N6-isopentenyl adenosine(37) hydroxylase MiaE n=1 Tax=Flavobacterium glycines TaxID=551990 RepID=A0A1B9DHM8_9FLAO|nr:tRNA-(ms[2]io[6]A)-hydroxylase [Flavobacterium glycines]OCB69187.1 tRNA hydroxylase [Flavobacterium glycines]GEL11877.1 tRNA 2-methylthio-N6-isopentenyl adenosine(37) hydroxylase MiaE [Flavobacterium glycines]SDJ58424.1 tRNA-(ms[2]io[6]A)-hydroxylase [Flavobacterium glycines]